MPGRARRISGSGSDSKRGPRYGSGRLDTLDENNPFYAEQREHDNCAAALIAAIESMEGDLTLGGLWMFAKDNSTFVKDCARIARPGNVPLVLALVAYESGVLMQFVAISEMPGAHLIATH